MDKTELLLLTKSNGYEEQTLEKFPLFSSKLYFTYIKPVPYVAYKITFQSLDKFKTWHDHLGHPKIGMIRKISEHFVGHN